MSGDNPAAGNQPSQGQSYRHNKRRIERLIEVLRRETKELSKSNHRYRGNDLSLSCLINFGDPFHDNDSLIFYDSLLPHWKIFAIALENSNQKIYKLTVLDIPLPRAVLGILKPALQSKNITSVELKNNGFAFEGTLFVSDILRACPAMEQLQLNSNKISDLDAANQISQAIRDHSSLKGLLLKHCDLGNNAALLSVILNGCKKIKDLRLCHEQISLQAFIIISNFLATNPLLERFGFHLNKLEKSTHNEAATHLVQALKRNENLRCINFWESCGMALDTKNILCNAVFDKSSLNAIYASNHTCYLETDDWKDEIYHILKINIAYETGTKNRTKKIWHALHDNTGGGLNLHYFNTVELKLMPHIFEFIWREPKGEACLSNIFELMRWKMPSLFVALIGAFDDSEIS